jgi:ABC-2 type transport system permease protein
MSAIFKRELKSYFSGMTGYFFAAFLIFLTGLYTMVYNFQNLYPNYEYVIYEMCFFYLIAIPILTMKAIAEDKKQKTDQLLYSLPLSMTQIVIGKFLAMVVMLLLPVAVMAIVPLILKQYGTIYFATIYSTLLAFYLLGCALIAIGLFLSSLTENQIVAAVLCFFALLICYMSVGLSSYLATDALSSYIAFAVCLLAVSILFWLITKSKVVGIVCFVVSEAALGAAYLTQQTIFESAFQKVLEQFSLFERLTNFVNGIFDITGIVYYLSIIFLFLFFTVQVMEKRRWN